MDKYVNIVKLSVGTETVEGLEAWQSQKRVQTTDGYPRHVTRMFPKRVDEITNGGSIYWVIKGSILCRQKIIRLDEVFGQDGIRRCAIVTEREMIRVAATLKRPFQGWRYLTAQDAPIDLNGARAQEEAIPAELTAALAEIGVL